MKAMELFIKHPKQKEWSNLYFLASGEPHTGKNDCALNAVNYYDALNRYLFPNSQALEGITPGQHVNQEKDLMEKAIRRLKICRSPMLLPLMKAMQHQNFDPVVRKAGKESQQKLGK